MDETAGNLETMLGLPVRWMDKAHSPSDVPEKALFAIHHEKAVATPQVNADKPRRGRPTTLVRQMKEAANAGEAPAPVATPAPVPAAPAAKQEAKSRKAPTPPSKPAPVAPTAPVAKTAEPVPAPATTPAAAPAVAPAETPAPVAHLAAEQEKPARTYIREAASTASIQYSTESGLSPVVDALVKTISDQARGGVLSEASAYRMLGELMGF